MQPKIRIAKAIARATGLSRRAAERLIFEKKVRLNGSIVDEPATHVHLLEEDAGARARRQQKRDALWRQKQKQIEERRQEG